MINNVDYIRLSLELHLFFARIMKEHSLFLEIGFTNRDAEYKRVANQFQTSFTQLLDKVIDISNNNISSNVILAQEIVTDKTLESESKTNELLGINIDQNITRKELNLKSGNPTISNQLLFEIDNINQNALPLIANLINFKEDIIKNVLTCKMFTANYPLLITHILNEAKMYYNLVLKLLNRILITPKEIYEQEKFWNNIMKEHAQFIRGLLDPTEENLINIANDFAIDYNKILNQYKNNTKLTTISLQKTTNFRDFKVTGETGILECKIKSIIIPLLADHVVREANHFIRILKEYQTIDTNNIY